MNRGGAPALALLGVSRRFGRVQALDSAHLTVRAGTVHAVLGENGAGKSTLMRIAFGLERADGGRIERDGHPVRFRSPHDAIASGIGMVHQHFTLVSELTVAENIALGGRGHFVRAEVEARVDTLARETGLAVHPSARVADLPVGAQQRVEILKACARGASVLILDEPTAVLTPSEIRELLTQVRRFAERGTAVVLITHKLREALDAADAVTVLRGGRTVLTTPAREVTEGALVEAMVGGRVPAVGRAVLGVSTGGGAGAARATATGIAAPAADHEHATPTDTAVIALDRATIARADGPVLLRDISCRIRGGEIVGIAGAEGSGVRELLRVLAGRAQPVSGRADRPSYVGFVPADRHRDALFVDGTLVENVALANAGARRGLMPWDALRETTRDVLDRFNVVASGPDALARSLSGGNQQRFVVGRELRSGARALVVENPSRGLDVRAAAALQEELLAARAAGVAVVVHTGDLEELVAVADRVLVCHAGRLLDAAPELDAVVRSLVGAV